MLARREQMGGAPDMGAVEFYATGYGATARLAFEDTALRAVGIDP